jgi:uncharacterized membrane protein
MTLLTWFVVSWIVLLAAIVGIVWLEHRRSQRSRRSYLETMRKLYPEGTKEVRKVLRKGP